MCEGVRYSKRDHRGNRTLMLESQLAAEFLRSLGADPADVVSDNLSLDTKGNAYFLRTTRTDVARARSFVVVTSGFHMARAKATFEKIFQLEPFPEGGSDYTLRFEEAPHSSIEPTALKRRVEWESSQLQTFLNISEQWRDLHDAHSYIFAGELANDSPPDRRAGKMPLSFTSMKLQIESQGDNSAESQGDGRSIARETWRTWSTMESSAMKLQIERQKLQIEGQGDNSIV
jgi:hypothetical protein